MIVYTYVSRYKNAIKVTEYEEVLNHRYDIILSTCNERCSKRLLKLAEMGRIAQCIVDECGMASEPETIAASSLWDHVMLIGDHKQIQPIIKYHMARECGMGISLFKRYAESRQDMLITLDEQYRIPSAEQAVQSRTTQSKMLVNVYGTEKERFINKMTIVLVRIAITRRRNRARYLYGNNSSTSCHTQP